MTVAEHDRLDLSQRELKPAHVLNDTGRRDAGIEEDRSLAAAGRHANERREARLGDQGVGQAVAGKRGGCVWLREVVKPGRALDLLRREEQRVGHVVHQDRDPNGVDRRERDGDHGQGCHTGGDRSPASPLSNSIAG